MYILTRIYVIKIGDFRHILNFIVCLLQARHYDGHIPCCCKVATLFVPEVLIFDIQQQLSIEGSEVRDSEAVVSVGVPADDVFGIGSGVA